MFQGYTQWTVMESKMNKYDQSNKNLDYGS